MKMKSILRSILEVGNRAWDGFLDLLFPSKCRCLACGKEVDDSYLCADCEKKLVLNVGARRCDRCSRPLVAEERFCPSCGGGDRTYFTKAFARYVYDGELTKMIHEFKFRRKAYYKEFFAEELRKGLESLPSVDVIVPVPMHPRRKRKRGYNQCVLLANELSRITGIPARLSLEKIIDTREQVGLSGEERRSNVKGSFKIADKEAIKGKAVLLIDDVMTTNATVNECARLLKLGGAGEVYVLALAITKTRGKQTENE